MDRRFSNVCAYFMTGHGIIANDLLLAIVRVVPVIQIGTIAFIKYLGSRLHRGKVLTFFITVQRYGNVPQDFRFDFLIGK